MNLALPSPVGVGRKHRSQLESEKWQSLWFTMVSRLLHLSKGPFSFKMPLLVAPASCHHPKEFLAKGANQYGRWERCTLCKVKLSFEAYSQENPRTVTKAAKNSSQDNKTAEKVQQATIKMTKAMAKAKASPYVTHQEMQDVMHQLIQGQRELQHQMTALVQSQAASSAVHPASVQQMPMDPHLQVAMVNLAQEEEHEEMLANPNDWEAVDHSL